MPAGGLFVHVTTDKVRTVLVRNAAEIERLRRFQTERYVESGLLDSPPTRGLDHDPLVSFSEYFGAYDDEGNILGTSRLIWASNADLPILNDHEIDPVIAEYLDANQADVTELSRVAVAKDAPQFATLAALTRAMLQHCARQGKNTLCLAAVDRPLLHLTRRVLGLPTTTIGEMRPDYYNKPSYPIMIHMVQYLTELRYRDSRMWHYITDGLVIDLTLGDEMAEPRFELDELPAAV